MAKKSIKNMRGFTLLEILVAMAILAIVLSTLYASFTKTLTEMNETELEADTYQMARVALDRMQEDLECGLLLKKKEPAKDEEGMSGATEFEGKNEQIDGRDADALTFFSFKHISFDDQDESSGLTRISFYVKENDGDQGLTLYRSDMPEFKNASEEKTGGLILCDNLFSVNFTYYSEDGDAHDQWNSSEGESKGKLPAMVSIQLSFISESFPEEPLKFETGVALPMAREISEENS